MKNHKEEAAFLVTVQIGSSF